LCGLAGGEAKNDPSCDPNHIAEPTGTKGLSALIAAGFDYYPTERLFVNLDLSNHLFSMGPGFEVSDRLTATVGLGFKF
jgi:hypothetical protein